MFNNKVEQTVDKFINKGMFKQEERTVLIEDINNNVDLDAFVKLTSKINVFGHQNFLDELDDSEEGAQNEFSGKTYIEIEKMGVNKTKEFINKYPEQYKKVFKEEYGVEPTI